MKGMLMGKIIINNESSENDITALELVVRVIREGRISANETTYCFGTFFALGEKEVSVFSRLNKKSDSFVVMDEKKRK